MPKVKNAKQKDKYLWANKKQKENKKKAKYKLS